MRLLLVAATDVEIEPAVAALQYVADLEERLTRYRIVNRIGPVLIDEVDVLTTGVGMVATAVWVTHTLAACEYDLALNVGVCGTFDPRIPLGTVVHVGRDRLAELGAENGDGFLALEQLHLPGTHDTAGTLVSEAPLIAPLQALPTVSGITVNTVHGNDVSIARVRERWSPQVESMEGAAFMYACSVAGVRHAQVRAVSNIVERRNREAWKMKEAIAALNTSVLEILAHL